MKTITLENKQIEVTDEQFTSLERQLNPQAKLREVTQPIEGKGVNVDKASGTTASETLIFSHLTPTHSGKGSNAHFIGRLKNYRIWVNNKQAKHLVENKTLNPYKNYNAFAYCSKAQANTGVVKPTSLKISIQGGRTAYVALPQHRE